jgi:RNA polymerase sigma-70 factor, ECF subfamily
MSTDTLARPAAAEPAAAELAALRQRLLRQARLTVHDAALAEDLVQDTLIAVLQQRASYRGDAALSTWAISILRHKVADWYRSPVARRETQLPDADDGALDGRSPSSRPSGAR